MKSAPDVAYSRHGDFRFRVVGSPAVFGGDQSMEIARAQLSASPVARKFHHMRIFPRGVPGSSPNFTTNAFMATNFKLQCGE